MILYKIQDSILKSPAKRDRLIISNLFLSLTINIFLWFFLLYNFWQANQYVVLGYNIYFGISLLGHWYQILIMPIMGLVVIAFNFSLGFYFYLKERLISYFLAGIASVFNIIVLLAALIIIYVNI